MKQRRNTRQRQLILAAVRRHRDHPSADQIYLEVRAADPRISRGTVYRNLKLLTDSGEIGHIRVLGAESFDWRRERHYHLLCTQCGSLCDAPGTYSPAADRETADLSGYDISHHQTVFVGICPGCRKKKPEVSDNAEAAHR